MSGTTLGQDPSNPGAAGHTQVDGPVARLRKSLPVDPGMIAFRRALRATVVMTPMFVAAKLLTGNVQFTIFIVFGCFVHLVMADFGGPRRSRAAAYAGTNLVGVVFIILGTFASQVAWVGALGMFVIGFVVQFTGVFGGYAVTAQSTLLLSYVLAVTVPATPSLITTRISGWVLAGAVSALAGLFLWPLFDRPALHRLAAQACREIAVLARVHRNVRDDAAVDERLRKAREAVDEAGKGYRASLLHPSGPARRDRAFIELLADLGAIVDFFSHPFSSQRASRPPALPEGDALEDAVVTTLEASADVLEAGPAPDLQRLDRARDVHRAALDRWAADSLRSGMPPEEVLEGFRVDDSLRLVSFRVLVIGVNAVIAAGREVTTGLALPIGTPREAGPRGFLVRIWRTVRSQLNPRSSVLHASLRVGIGLALAVFLARELQLQNAFWVVFGTLSVLRTTALATGRTAASAVAGTVVGFIVGAAFMAVIGTGSIVLWVTVPIVIFLAAYAPSAIGFIVGQAAFTILVIILFNLISPIGWRIGLIRIEDVAVGTGISVVVGLLLWPRGAGNELRLAVSDFYHAVAGYLAASISRILDHESKTDAMRVRAQVAHARARADEAFDLYLHERGIKRLDPRTSGLLVDSGTQMLLIGDALNVVADMGYGGDGCSDSSRSLQQQRDVVLQALHLLATRLKTLNATTDPLPEASDARVNQAALSCLRRWREDPAIGQSAVGVVRAGEWIEEMGRLVASLEEPVSEMVQASGVPWWR